MSTGFSFGSKPTAPTFGQSGGFGAPTTGSITFGIPAVQSHIPFGATTQSSTAFGSTNFGMPIFATPASTTQNTGMTFGTPATGTTGFSFGTATVPSSVPNTGLTFGTPSALTAATAGFGAPTPASTGLTFGTPATTAPTGFSFGTPGSTGLTFSNVTTTTSAPSFGFNTSSTQPAALSLGQTQTTASGTGLFAGNTFAFTTPTTSAAPASSAPTFNLGFGATTTTTPLMFSLTTPTTTTTTALNFNLGTTTQSGGLSFGIGGTTSASTLPKSTATVTTSTQPIYGLGGIIQSTPKSETSTTGKQDVIPHDQQLPNEVQQALGDFKNYTKQEKGCSSDVARISAKEFKKVTAAIDQVGNFLNEAEKQLQNNRAVAERLKMDTARGLQNIEMAQRTMDTPPGLQYDNVMPMAFFRELIDHFEKELQNLKLQIEYTDKYMRNLEQPIPLNSQDLAVGMRRLHETFVALAGRLQTVHSQVESQREQYINFRKYMLNDDTNIFENTKNQSDILNITFSAFDYKPPAVASGPSPFNSLTHPSVIQAAAQNQTQSTTTGNTGFGVPQPTNTTASSIFGNTTGFGTNIGQAPTLQFNSPSNTNFQLQKPPSGNKRGKQITY